MKPRHFFVIYLNNSVLKNILDAIRIVADSSQRNCTHITVKGPYNTIQKEILKKDNLELRGKTIKVSGAGNFFSDIQNTVFLKCEHNNNLYNVWKSKEDKTYKEFNPHITIYDGNNKLYAKNLFELLNSSNIQFSFIIDQLELYSSNQKHRLFNLRSQADYDMISEIAGKHITCNNIGSLKNKQRLVIIKKLLNNLEETCYTLSSAEQLIPSPAEA